MTKKVLIPSCDSYFQEGNIKFAKGKEYPVIREIFIPPMYETITENGIRTLVQLQNSVHLKGGYFELKTLKNDHDGNYTNTHYGKD